MTEPNDARRSARLGPWLVLKRLARQCAIPALLAAAYAYWSFATSKKAQSPADVVGKVGVAFFFIMWFVGQYFRAEKQLQDAEHLESIDAKVDRIVAAVTANVTAGLGAPPSVPADVPLRDPVSRTLMDEAHSAIRGGSIFSGLLAASVAFEHAVQAAARRLGAPLDRNLGLPQQISWLARYTGDDVAAELHSLRAARDRLVHLRGEPPDLRQADRLWSELRWAVSYLEQVEPRRA
jgi:hypothetical protein